MQQKFQQIPVSELRVKLPQLKGYVKASKLRLACTRYGCVVGFLVPLEDIDKFNASKESKINKEEVWPLTEFRERLAEVNDLFIRGVDCLYLTAHKRRIIAFVSPRFAQWLPGPAVSLRSVQNQFFSL